MKTNKSSRKKLVRSLAYCVESLIQCAPGIDSQGAVCSAMDSGGDEIWEYVSSEIDGQLSDLGYHRPED